MASEIVEAFDRIRRDAPDRPLIYLPATDTALTTTNVSEAAAQIARDLDDAGCGRRTLIAGVIGNRPAAVSAFLACRARGGPYLPLDAGTTTSEIGDVGRQFGVAAMLLATPQPIPGFSRLASLASGLTLALADADPGETRFADAVVLKMTSGSSGRPRATLTGESALLTDSRALMTAMEVHPDAVQVAAIPLSHAYGFGNLLVPALIQGTALVMREAFVPHRLPDDARRFGASAYPGVPFMFDHFACNPPAGGWPPALQQLITAGAPIERALVEKFHTLFGVKIHSFYGTSETGGIAFDDTDAPGPEGMVGKALPHVAISLVAQDGAPPGTGRVHVKGPAVISGYADGVDAECFVDCGFLTGDLGAFDDERQLTLSGRISSFVNVAGRKVQPDEVERVLRLMEGVADVRVIGVADPRRGQQLVAGLVMRGPRPPMLALRQFCGARLAAYKIPRSFVFLEEIPLTERGKTDRRQLETLVLDALRGDTGML